MNDQVLLDRMTRTSASAPEKLGLRMDESERYKLGEPAGILLDVTQQKQVAHPMFLSFGVAVHHCGCRGDAEAMRRPNDFDPLPHLQLVGAQRFADLIVENFRGRGDGTKELTIVELYRLGRDASLPEARRNGYAEAVMRHSLEAAARSSGLSRTVLHATALGYPVYRAMGYRQVAFFHVYFPQSSINGLNNPG